MTREEMKNEAIKRMRKLGLFSQVIKEFKEEDILHLSESGGYLYWLDEKQKKIVEDFEKESGNIVYHVVRSFTNMGEMLSLLIVSKYEEDWEMDWENIPDGYVFSYVVNLDEPMFSEYGTITVQNRIGGLVRLF